MSKSEVRLWLMWLGGTGVGAVLALFLPVNGLILLLYLLIGILVAYCPPVFLYSLLSFALSWLTSLVLPRWGWLRLGVSVVVVLGVAHLVSSHLNKAHDRAFAQAVAHDVPLKTRPSFTRVVLVDERGDFGPGPGREDVRPCGTDGCIPYLANAQAQAVLLPASRHDPRPVEQRDYRIFRQRPGCAPTVDFNDLTNRIWTGGCLVKAGAGKVAPGDVIVHAFRVTVPYAARGCACERVEVFVMTALGPQLIERVTMFQMGRYGDIPMPLRDAGWNGSNYDHGVNWTIQRGYGRNYDTVRKDDLGLRPEVEWHGGR